jgi:nucleotide-binding universal stress UspA family protein
LVPHLGILSDRAESEVIVLEAVSFLETLIEMPVSLAGKEFGKSGDTDFAEKYVAGVVELLKSRGIRSRGLTQIGSEVATIASVARRQRASLIALAVRERSGFPQTLFRTLAEQVLRASPTPIYAVPARTTEPEAPPPAPGGTVLVPIDGTGLSLQVIPPVADFCRRFSARLRFVHIVPRGADDAAARRALATALERARREGADADSQVVEGDPAEEILRLCEDRSVSMIAMRTRLAMGEANGPLGSVTLRVLRAAKVPMLIVRRPPRSSPAPAHRSASRERHRA